MLHEGPGQSAAAREAQEETGLTGALVPLGYRHEYLSSEPGRKQTRYLEHAFLLRVPAGQEPRLSEEHVGFRWTAAAEASALLQWESHRETLRLALRQE
jgi:8-oxo-dGTP pyrophosphatase MutT (NUDIX family)